MQREKRQLEKSKESLDKEFKRRLSEIDGDCKKHMEALQRLTLGLGRVYEAKSNLREMLETETSSPGAVYKELQKTVKHPDVECLRMYAKALARFERNVDIVRVVRNGLLEYAFNPREGACDERTDEEKE